MTRIITVVCLLFAFAWAQESAPPPAKDPAPPPAKDASAKDEAAQKSSDAELPDPTKSQASPPKAAPPAVPNIPTIPTVMEGKPSYTISGTKYWDMTVGAGKKAIPGFTIRVHYTGWYKKNKTNYVLFDSSRGRGPLQFDLGMRKVIKGWDEGIRGMRVGGKRQLVIPPEAAYGREGTAGIPGNTTLIFEVELVEVR